MQELLGHADVKTTMIYTHVSTVAYNVVEGIASVLFSFRAGSAALLGFGADSFVESLSGSVMANAESFISLYW